jgi:hypothetical protein
MHLGETSKKVREGEKKELHKIVVSDGMQL